MFAAKNKNNERQLNFGMFEMAGNLINKQQEIVFKVTQCLSRLLIALISTTVPF